MYVIDPRYFVPVTQPYFRDAALSALAASPRRTRSPQQNRLVYYLDIPENTPFWQEKIYNQDGTQQIAERYTFEIPGTDKCLRPTRITLSSHKPFTPFTFIMKDEDNQPWKILFAKPAAILPHLPPEMANHPTFRGAKTLLAYDTNGRDPALFVVSQEEWGNIVRVTNIAPSPISRQNKDEFISGVFPISAMS